MIPSPDPRYYELAARLLRSDDREEAIHGLLYACLHGPDAFGGLLAHLPADLPAARQRGLLGLTPQQVQVAVDALERAACALRHIPPAGGVACTADCSCRAVRLEGENAFLGRRVVPVASVLAGSAEPYYQHLGELLERRVRSHRARVIPHQGQVEVHP